MNPFTLADLTKQAIDANKLNCSAQLQPVQCPFCDMLTWHRDHIENHIKAIDQEYIDAKEMLEEQDEYDDILADTIEHRL
ncbi:ORF60 protein [Operophtera brumata nucleopolyhedrovirus]|uniref:ORF60 protein n=1 Tax=Operophtera brumata nucleopolyhedrovirus TaxID=1046267 RepID=A0A2H4UZU3_9ABAC|nr:ORF60 protein [Operophtera brumata nucleopolyhedrovirus]AUA60291.1 ORF60 protein [Operophtera brumata nucleopolyhedrovirus]